MPFEDDGNDGVYNCECSVTTNFLHFPSALKLPADADGREICTAAKNGNIGAM